MSPLETKPEERPNGFEITLKTRITQDHIDNIIVGALEGGSNYWYIVDERGIVGLPERKGDGSVEDSLAMRISKGMMEQNGFNMPVFDLSNYDLLGTLTREKMEKALATVSEMYPEVLQRILLNEEDADDCDIVFQFAIMGDLVFC